MPIHTHYRYTYSNCLFWSLWMKLTKGGHIKMRPSHLGFFPHFLWTPDREKYYSFTPTDERYKFLPPPIFQGYVRAEGKVTGSYSNCLFWALYKFWKEGGWMKMRMSHYVYFPHFLWSKDDIDYYSFSPVDPKVRLLPPPIFWGEVKKEPPLPRRP